ncbi:oligosaccharide biosynthesis protein Alg14 like protein [Aspergillus costaricaensis CBS 115574]|uniref:Oligosaccharide biosynthesis protein Alg14 like protein n=1 Tax=Aspergillus costaricaensis CBS 115574 TaxID=1448317 RepID=A0ACD1ICG7_9EURO|nr:oligosaccharide biosynthesis protein Alg14 like protein [Aspergillus costaricaensis CBS 115574]RAK88171.1 oligosaccharide biosynthesis protein Alg14 like protein [Aspergillus costaricaensis CBS 115574]
MESWLSWTSLFLAIGFTAIACIFTLIVLIYALAKSQNSQVPKWRPRNSPVHLLVVLGSGGHTAEMFSMLRRMNLDPSKYTHRTYIVSSGDNFSATKAVEFETTHINHHVNSNAKIASPEPSYTIVTVPRARRVHQSYLTAPFSTLNSFWSCLSVLRGLHPDQSRHSRPASHLSPPYPDLILTNGPATAVCVIVAARLLRLWLFLCGLISPFAPGKRTSESDSATAPVLAPGTYQLRTIFVESWARVTTLSLSGKLLLPLADRFLVQWPALAGKKAWPGMKETEYVGTLMD